jgi:hypothetical protein
MAIRDWLLRAALLCVAAFALGGCLVGCPRSGPPAPDTCSPATADGVASLAMGNGSRDGSFVPWSDGARPTFAVGGQGATMLVMRILVTGDDPPACLEQSTVVESGTGPFTTLLGRDSRPRKTYPTGVAGERLTDDLYIVLDEPEQALDVTTTVGALSVTLHLGPPYDTDFSGPHDLGSDASPSD